MLPISSADLIEFFPARERVTKATAALIAAQAVFDEILALAPQDLFHVLDHYKFVFTN